MTKMAWRRVWTKDALALCVLGLLAGKDVARLVQVDKATRASVRRVFKRYRAGTMRLGLALWCHSHVELEFQSYYQELATHQIARSNVRDPRVPPRVVSVWEERGKVPGGVVTLRPELLPKRTERGFILRFVAANDQNPMLFIFVQSKRLIYTMVTLKIAKTRGSDIGGGLDGENDSIVLRQLYYLKEYGEWRAMVPAAEKRLLDEYGALCRYDLVSHDGSVALELDVPRGADSMMDYYLVKRAVVCLPMEELLRPFVKAIQPPAKLPPARGRTATYERCLVQWSFSSMSGETIASHTLPCQLTAEQQETSQSAQAEDDASSDDTGSQTSTLSEQRPRTGIEHFDIITVKALDEILKTTKVEMPREPGFVWLSILCDQPSTKKKPAFFTAVMLHSGAKRTRAMLTLEAQWVPGTLEAFPTPQSRQRRVLKGFLTLASDMETHELHELKIVAQHLPAARLEPYAASIQSYTRPN